MRYPETQGAPTISRYLGTIFKPLLLSNISSTFNSLCRGWKTKAMSYEWCFPQWHVTRWCECRLSKPLWRIFKPLKNHPYIALLQPTNITNICVWYWAFYQIAFSTGRYDRLLSLYGSPVQANVAVKRVFGCAQGDGCLAYHPCMV